MAQAQSVLGKDQLIFLSEDVIQRCRQFGNDIVANYGEYCTAYGIEHDPVAQALARVAECAVCEYFELPLSVLDWGMRKRGDRGCDLLAPGVGRVDSKWTRHRDGALIWPVMHNDKLAGKVFDVFVLVTGLPQHGLFVSGWTTKQFFMLNKDEAGPGHPRFYEGTWYLDQPLNPMDFIR